MHRALLLALALGCEGPPVATFPPPDDTVPTDPVPTTTPDNAPPAAPAVSIDPALPADTADLVCAFTPSSDPDGDTLAHTIAWRRDGAVWTGPTATTHLPGDTIPRSATGQEDVWTCEVTASDGALAALGSATVVVAYWPAEDLRFEPCGAVGSDGPDQAACDDAYAAGPLHGLVVVDAGFQHWTVPATGEYWLSAAGARGASASPLRDGGAGALVASPFFLEAGSVVTVAVGQRGVGDGTLESGGGGGGTWVALDGAIVLVAAGGGGVRMDAEDDGCGGNVGIDAGLGSGNERWWDCPVAHGAPGSPGAASATGFGSGGAGLLGDGHDDDDYGTGGATWDHGLAGGVCTAEQPLDGAGGFGGGGAGCGWFGGGGGGGYTGGGGGWIAGGGGSFVDGPLVVGQSSANAGDGWLVINLLEDDTISGP